jgi:hypothetical protein
VDHYAPTPDALVRPWRTATIIATGVAAIELLALLGLGIVYFGQSWFADARATAGKHAVAGTTAEEVAPATTDQVQALTPKEPATPATPMLGRVRTSILVLNGNGIDGAAGAEARALRARGYKVAAVGNAKRSDYASSIAMYLPGYGREARRLARDMDIPIVTVLDGVRQSELKNAKLTLIVGGS